MMNVSMMHPFKWDGHSLSKIQMLWLLRWKIDIVFFLDSSAIWKPQTDICYCITQNKSAAMRCNQLIWRTSAYMMHTFSGKHYNSQVCISHSLGSNLIGIEVENWYCFVFLNSINIYKPWTDCSYTKQYCHKEIQLPDLDLKKECFTVHPLGRCQSYNNAYVCIIYRPNVTCIGWQRFTVFCILIPMTLGHQGHI